MNPILIPLILGAIALGEHFFGKTVGLTENNIFRSNFLFKDRENPNKNRLEFKCR